jgi:tRNA pseudouridine55 synthase
VTDGFAIVDKPAGMTSHDVVSRARRQLSERRIGHAGTLDPDATGVLLLGIGRATRLLQFLSGRDKTYVAEIELGTETDTLDAAGRVTATHDMQSVTVDDVVAAAAQFVGDIEQVPPMVSAIKIDGRRLHELAREGIEVERPPRRVHIARLVIEPQLPALPGAARAPLPALPGAARAQLPALPGAARAQLPALPGAARAQLPALPGAARALVFRAEIDCSSGTYIRSLAADLGRALGGGAHLKTLRRTRIGAFTIDEACALDELVVRPMIDAMRGTPSVVVSDEIASLVGNGRVFPRDELGVGDGDGPWNIVSSSGELLAVYAPHSSQRVKPTVVLVPS